MRMTHQEIENMKTCPTCKKQIDDGARTCPNCGKRFTTVGGVFIAVLIGLILGGFFLSNL